MSKVITFSRTFPAYHPKAGQLTHFVNKIINGLTEMNFNFDDGNFPAWNEDFCNNLNFATTNTKFHTIRSGNRWKVGDKFSPRVWGTDINPVSGRSGPYHSKQIIIAPDIEIKKVWDIEFRIDPFLPPEEAVLLLKVDGHYMTPEIYIPMMAKNDGLTLDEFINWFTPKPEMVNFSGQIICWNENINY